MPRLIFVNTDPTRVLFGLCRLTSAGPGGASANLRADPSTESTFGINFDVGMEVSFFYKFGGDVPQDCKEIGCAENRVVMGAHDLKIKFPSTKYIEQTV